MVRPKKRRTADYSGERTSSPESEIETEAAIARAQANSGFTFTQVIGSDARITGTKGIYFSEWFGRGLDDWVRITIRCLWEYAATNQLETATIVSYADSMKHFLRYLDESGTGEKLSHPRNLQPFHIQEYFGWLQRLVQRKHLGRESARRYLSGLKAIVARLIESGVMEGEKSNLFPSRQFRGIPPQSERFGPLSSSEQARLATALKADLTDLHHGRLSVLPSEAIASYFLLVAMRTGANATPLLEASRFALKSGLLPNSKILELYKRRAHRVNRQAVGTDGASEGLVPTPIDTVAVWNYVLQMTKPLVASAPPAVQDRVWLYRVSKGAGAGRITALDASTLYKSISKLVERRQLRSDQGTPLQINARRLRTSFAQRAFIASGGDLAITADLLGNVPQVADKNYLVLSDELKIVGAQFMSTSLTQALRRRLDAKRSRPSAASDPPGSRVETPIAHCGNTTGGELAPQDGVSHCTKFALCLFCSSFTVIGDEDELWRLFSYQVFVERDMVRLREQYGKSPCGDERVDALQEMYAQIVPFITELVEKRFGTRIAARSRKKALSCLHPFWLYQERLSQPVSTLARQGKEA